MPAILVVIVIVAVLAVVIPLASAQRRRTQEAWAAAARQLGLAYTAPSGLGHPTISGNVDQIAVKVDTHTQRSGDNSQTYTRYRVRYPSQGVDYDLHRQTGFSTITRMFGAQDVEVGDTRFDDTFVVKSNHPERVAAVMTPTRRATLLQLAAGFPGVKISNTRIEWSKRGVANNEAHLVTVVRRLVGAAFVVAGISGADTALDHALKARDAGDLSDAAQQIRTGKVVNRESLELRRIEAETLAEAGEPDAAERLAELAVELPDDPEVRGWQEQVAAPRPAPPTPAAAPAASPPDFVDAETVAADLFGQSRLSFETRGRFDERYLGRTARWTGTIKSTREFRRDPDLGEEPGTRVVVTVAAIANDLYGQTTVDAVVGLTAGNANVLRGRDSITFEGTLTGIDAMARNLFVKDARLV